MMRFPKEVALVIGTGTAAAMIAAATWYRFNKRRNAMPEKWLEVGEVQDLWIYPMKSCQAIPIEEAECTETGLLFVQDNKLPLRDRAFLTYKAKDGEYRTGKNYPQMVLIAISAISEREIRFEAPNMSPLIIDLGGENPKYVSLRMWKGEIVNQCIDCGDEAARWMSQYCLNSDSGLRLGLYTDWQRTVNQVPWTSYTKVYKNLTTEDMGRFGDITSYTIVNQSSMDDLNEKLSKDLSTLFFRPNIVVKGPPAFTEDDWDWVKIGDDIVLRNVKLCTRCNLVNLDPDTGTMLPKQEVLKKLQEYRLVSDEKLKAVEGSSPVMGIHLGIRRLGHIKIGDKVYVGI